MHYADSLGNNLKKQNAYYEGNIASIRHQNSSNNRLNNYEIIQLQILKIMHN